MPPLSKTKLSPTGYTYTDEQWKVHNITPTREYRRRSSRRFPPSPLPPLVEPRTAEEKAARVDLELWWSSSSVEEYEIRKKELAEEAAAEHIGPTFHLFPRLPLELRWKVWQLAMEEPTHIEITSIFSLYTKRRSRGMKTRSEKPWNYAATAYLPPLMLVNHESYSLARKHYQRAFRDRQGVGGVVAAYPSVVTVDAAVLKVLKLEDIEVIEGFIVRQTNNDLMFDSFDLEFQLQGLFGGGKLRKLEVRTLPEGSKSFIVNIYDMIKSLFDKARAGNTEWVAPGVRLVLTHEGENDEVIYHCEGGLLSSLPGLGPEFWNSGSFLGP